MIVRKVWSALDNDGYTIIPPEAGQPTGNQFQSTHLDNLIELAGRICYDSVGGKKTRSTSEYHRHIISVHHTSVHEHVNLTVEFGNILTPETRQAMLSMLVNRPGVSVNFGDENNWNIRVTANIRAIREWKTFDMGNNALSDMMCYTFQHYAKSYCPQAMQDILPDGLPEWLDDCTIQTPRFPNEIWTSFYLGGVSRGFSHELVRHKWRTAVSQRSTRYVDESKSKWAWHPLLTENWSEYIDHVQSDCHFGIIEPLNAWQVADIAASVYDKTVSYLEAKLTNGGIDKFTARKMSRGAARGILGNALSTELIFSASMDQWARIILQRCNNAADAEIRSVISKVYDILSRDYDFNFKIITAQDGFGYHIERKY